MGDLKESAGRLSAALEGVVGDAARQVRSNAEGFAKESEDRVLLRIGEMERQLNARIDAMQDSLRARVDDIDRSSVNRSENILEAFGGLQKSIAVTQTMMDSNVVRIQTALRVHAGRLDSLPDLILRQMDSHLGETDRRMGVHIDSIGKLIESIGDRMNLRIAESEARVGTKRERGKT